MPKPARVLVWLPPPQKKCQITLKLVEVGVSPPQAHLLGLAHQSQQPSLCPLALLVQPGGECGAKTVRPLSAGRVLTLRVKTAQQHGAWGLQLLGGLGGERDALVRGWQRQVLSLAWKTEMGRKRSP